MANNYDKNDYYAILEIITTHTPSTPLSQIKKSYRKLALVHHPDKKLSGTDIIFKRITAAYEVLTDDIKRRDYDYWYQGYFRRLAVTSYEIEKEQRRKVQLEKTEGERLQDEQQNKEKLSKEKEQREKKEKAERLRREKEEREQRKRDEEIRKEREREREYIKLKHEQKQRKLREAQEREKKIFEKRREEERAKMEQRLKEEQKNKEEETRDKFEKAKKRKEERRRKLQELNEKRSQSKSRQGSDSPAFSEEPASAPRSAHDHLNNGKAKTKASADNVPPHLDPSLSEHERLYHKLRSLEEESTNLGFERDELEDQSATLSATAERTRKLAEEEFAAAKLKYENDCKVHDDLVSQAEDAKSNSDLKHTELLVTLDSYDILLQEYELKFGKYNVDEDLVFDQNAKASAPQKENKEKSKSKAESSTTDTPAPAPGTAPGTAKPTETFSFQDHLKPTSRFDFKAHLKPTERFDFSAKTKPAQPSQPPAGSASSSASQANAFPSTTFSFQTNPNAKPPPPASTSNVTDPQPDPPKPARQYKYPKSNIKPLRAGNPKTPHTKFTDNTSTTAQTPFIFNNPPFAPTSNGQVPIPPFNGNWQSAFQGINLNGPNNSINQAAGNQNGNTNGFTNGFGGNKENSQSSHTGNGSSTASDNRRGSGFRL